jgi:hypothetical protein
MSSTTSTTEDRALALLGKGVPPTAVANALGVDPSRITQLLGDEDFAERVVQAKFESLSKSTERDGNIDTLEDRLLDKLRDCLPFMTRPMEIIKSFQIINGAKRRGAQSADTLAAKQTIIQLNIPQIVLEKFTSNIHNQVIQVGSQSLLTIPSGQLLKSMEIENVNRSKSLIPISNQSIPTSP